MWNELSARHLLALRAVAEEGTFGRAATRLGFTQSAVSQQVAALEQMVGQSLFDRPAGPRRPELTTAGELMLEHADRILEEIRLAEQNLDRFARGVVGKLSIAVFQSISSRVLPSVLGQLHRHAPDVEINVLVEEADQYIKLANGDVDLLCVSGEIPEHCDSRSLGTDPHVALVPTGYPDGPVDLLTLSGKPMVGQPKGDSCSLEVDQGLERLGVTPNFAFRSHDNAAVQGMIGAGVGIAVVPLLTVDLSDPATEIRPTLPEIPPRQLSIVWLKGRTLSPIAQRFIEIAVEVCERTFAAAPETEAA
jgi:DNA-binding transcriptional LysR family regulator